MNNAMLLYAHLTDKELLRKVKSGHKVCYEVLIRRHAQALYRVGRMYCFSHTEAEDLLHHTLVDVHINHHEFDGTISFRTWLTKKMIHKCTHLKKHVKDQSDNCLSEPSASQVRSSHHYDSERLLLSKEITGKLESIMEQLPLPLRSVYILSEIDGFSNSEIAHLLHATEEDVKHQLSLAKASLRKALRRWFQYSDLYLLDHHSCDRVVHLIMKRLNEKTEIPIGVPTF